MDPHPPQVPNSDLQKGDQPLCLRARLQCICYRGHLLQCQWRWGLPGGCSSEVAECWVAGTYYTTKTCSQQKRHPVCPELGSGRERLSPSTWSACSWANPPAGCWSEAKYALVCHFTQAEVCPLASSSHTRHTSVPCIPMRSGPVRTIAVPPAPHSPGALLVAPWSATQWYPKQACSQTDDQSVCQQPGAPTRPKWSVAAWATLSLGAALPEAGGTPSVPWPSVLALSPEDSARDQDLPTVQRVVGLL